MKKAPQVRGWITGGFLGLCATAALALYVYLGEPYIDHRAWRASGELETIEVVYTFYMCGENVARAHEIVSGETSDRPTTVALPDGLPWPEDTALAVNGNVFYLTGYRYRAEERNILTGEIRSVPSSRFDVLSWQVKTPYLAWSAPGDEGAAELQTQRNEPVRFAMTGPGPDPDSFAQRHHASCG